MLYNTIQHSIRNKAGLSLIDYCLLESIYKLSTSPKATYKGWCNASKKTFEYLATSRTITTRLKHLEETGWIEFKDKSRLLKRTTNKYYSEVVAYILGVKYLHPPHEETSPNNNKDNNKEREKEILKVTKIEVDNTPRKKYYIQDKRMDKNQPFDIVTSSQTLRAFYGEDSEELIDLVKECFDLETTHEEISDCINSFSTVAIGTNEDQYKDYKDIRDIEKLKGKFLRWIPTHLKYAEMFPKKYKPKKIKRKSDYDLDSYFSSVYSQKAYKRLKLSGKIEEDKELFSKEFDTLLEVSSNYPNDNFNPMLVFEVLYKPLGKFLHGSTPTKKAKSLLRFMSKLNDYNQNRGDIRKLLIQAKDRQAL